MRIVMMRSTHHRMLSKPLSMSALVRRQCVRHASTTSGSNAESNPGSQHDPELLRLLHLYPTGKHPTPYEVLNLKSGSGFKKGELKQRFFKLAKIYHPDSHHSTGMPLNKPGFFTASEELTLLNDEIKQDRFKKILSAYNLLRNPIAKANYDKYHIGWEDNSSFRSNPNMYDPQNMAYEEFARRSRSYTAYKSGTWEDSYKHGYESAYGFPGDKYWHASESGDFKEEFNKNKKTFLLSTFLFVGVYFALQMSHMYLYDDFIGGKYNESTVKSVKMHDKSEEDLFHAYTNYGLGETKEDRINRFLWWRKFTMMLSLGEITEILQHFQHRGIIQNDSDTVQIKEFNNDHEIIPAGAKSTPST